MTITPFLALKLRGKKDAILARQRARRIASLLAFDPYEQACIAAGVFVVACHALERFGKATICFQIENHQLQVFAESSHANAPSCEPANRRLEGLLPIPKRNRCGSSNLCRPPTSQLRRSSSAGWCVRSKASGESVFDEIARQNREILALLHELRLYRGRSADKRGKITFAPCRLMGNVIRLLESVSFL